MTRNEHGQMDRWASEQKQVREGELMDKWKHVEMDKRMKRKIGQMNN